MGFFTDKLNQSKEPEEEGSPPEVAPSVETTAPVETGPAGKGFFTQKLAKQKPVETAEPESTVTADTPWSEVLTKGAKNFIPDVGTTAVDIGTGIKNTVLHPIDTAAGVGALAKGTDDYLQDNDTPEREVATRFGRTLKHEYGTEEGWKQGIAERPFARALDVGTAMLAPEFAARKLGAEGLAKGISAANPATWIEKGVEKAIDLPSHIGQEVAGEMGTHTGGWSLALGRQAGKESPEMAAAYNQGLKSKVSIDDLVGGFEQAAEDHKIAGWQKYQADERALRSDSQRLGFGPLDEAISKAERDFIGPLNAVPNPEVVEALEKIKALVQTQKRAAGQFDMDQLNAKFHMDPSEFNPNALGANPHLDPLGMDKLKKAIGRVTATMKGGEAKKAAGDIQRALTKQIKDAAPIYDKQMREYSIMSDALDAFKSELGIGKDPDAALRKLFSSLRTNVASSFWRRRALVQELAKNPEARKSLYSLAGQYNSALWPRGLMGQMKMGAGLLAAPYALPFLLAHPAGLFSLGTQSPRLMGKLSLTQGRLERQLGKVPWRGIMGPAAHYGSMPPWAVVNPALEEAGESPYAKKVKGTLDASPYAQQAMQYLGVE